MWLHIPCTKWSPVAAAGCKHLLTQLHTLCLACLQPDRQKIMNMITIDAHSRDIVANMVKEGTPNANSFLWMCQLRSYWDSSISDCRIKICDATFGYGYEYLGNGPRLVITPLTDRIYITATQACWLCMGTAPAGPAGEDG
jgi:dynein heavy chain